MEEKKTSQSVSRRGFLRGAAVGAGTIALTGIAAVQSDAAPVPKKWDMVADVVVIGFGGAGACAALESARAGASVLLLEKTAVPGGSTTLSGGIVYAAGTKFQKSEGIEDTPEAMYKYLMACGQGRAVPELVKVASEMSSQNVDWLAGMGAVFTKELLAMSGMEAEPEYKAVTAPQKRGHRVKGTGSALFRVLADAVKKEKNIKILTNTPGVRLITRATLTASNSEVIGVKATRNRREVNIKAKKAVVLTTGGIMPGEGTEGWLKDYSPGHREVHPGGQPQCHGRRLPDGNILRRRAQSIEYRRNPSLRYVSREQYGGHRIRQHWGLPNIYVKTDGTRFTNEGANYVLVSEAMFEKKATTAFCIFDSSTVQKAFDLGSQGNRNHENNRPEYRPEEPRRAGEEGLPLEREYDF